MIIKDTIENIVSATYATKNNIEVNISPNPAFQQLKIDIKKTDHAPLDMELINTQGISLFSSAIYESRTIDLSSYPAGMYFVKIYDKDKNVKIHKFIKQD